MRSVVEKYNYKLKDNYTLHEGAFIRITSSTLDADITQKTLLKLVNRLQSSITKQVSESYNVHNITWA